MYEGLRGKNSDWNANRCSHLPLWLEMWPPRDGWHSSSAFLQRRPHSDRSDTDRLKGFTKFNQFLFLLRTLSKAELHTIRVGMIRVGTLHPLRSVFYLNEVDFQGQLVLEWKNKGLKWPPGVDLWEVVEWRLIQHHGQKTPVNMWGRWRALGLEGRGGSQQLHLAGPWILNASAVCSVQGEAGALKGAKAITCK